MGKVKRTKLGISRIALIIGAILIPLMYSYFYLNAFWDPYSRLDTVPVAVVNEDEGAVINGEERNVGDELSEELDKDGSLEFHFVDEDTAVEGTKAEDYYAMLKIPSDFSENIAINGTSGASAKIEYLVNDKRNYLASQILNNAVNKIQKKLNSNINEEIASTMAGKLGEIPDQLGTLSDGMGEMYTGSEKLSDGADKLSAGAAKFDSGVQKADAGAAKVAAGAKKVNKGAGDLSSGADELDNGMGDLKDGTDSLASKLPDLAKGISDLDTGMNGDSGLKAGIAGYTAGVSSVESGVSTLKSGADSLCSGMGSAKQGILQASKANLGLTDAQAAGLSQILDSGFSDLESGAAQLSGGLSQTQQGLSKLTSKNEQLNSGAEQIGSGLETLDSNIPALEKGVGQLQSGMSTAKSGSSQLASGAKKLKSGTSQLYTGSSTLASGTGVLAEGSSSLADGAETLSDGADELSAGIGSGKKQVEDKVSDARSQTAALDGIGEKAAEPVAIEEKNYEYVPNYGTAFAPYFMSLSLWVGGLIIFFGIYFDPKKRYNYLCYDSEKPVLRSFVYLLLGLAQALLLAVIVKYALGLQVHNMAAFVASCVLVSVVFISIIQFFIVHLGDLGKLLAMLMLILQLTACGGTFPMETVPKMFNVLYPFMPMTYSVRLFKETISGTVGTGMMKNLTVLISILVVFMALTILFSLMKFGGKKIRQRLGNEVHQPA